MDGHTEIISLMVAGLGSFSCFIFVAHYTNKVTVCNFDVLSHNFNVSQIYTSVISCCKNV